MARGGTRKNFKKKRKAKSQSKVKKLLEINKRSLSKGQQKHLRDFGELHPVDEGNEDGDLAPRAKRVRNVEKVDDSREFLPDSRMVASTTKEDDESDSYDEYDPYQQLIETLSKGSETFIDLLKRKKREEAGQEDDDESNEHDNENTEDDDGVGKELHEINSVDGSEIDDSSKGDTIVLKDSDDGVDGDMDESLKAKSKANGGITVKGKKHLKGARPESDIEEEDDMVNGDAEEDLKMEDEEESSDDEGDIDGNPCETGQLDPFAVHFQQDLEEDVEIKLQTSSAFQQQSLTLPALGCGTALLPQLDVPLSDIPVSENSTLSQLKVKTRLSESWPHVNMLASGEQEKKLNFDISPTPGQFTPVQQQLFQGMNSYKDIFFSNRNFDNGEEIRRLYCLHAVNHALKTRSRVLKNNAKIVQAQKENKEVGELRDQGLTRPKVLILVPFRDAALKIVEIIAGLLAPAGKGQVMNRKRFHEEYSEPEETEPRKGFQPDDFKAMFTGNIDDCFRVGITVMRKGLKLYTEFYSSDIILASPLGLRAVIGGEGEKTRDCDFLSSIELLILDQADVFLMQNWEHVQHIFNHLHLQPRDPHDVDFSRVRMWCLNGWSKYYRQTVIFSSFVSPEMNSLFNKNCNNFAGKLKISNGEIPGSMQQVVAQVPQVFHRIDCQNFSKSLDARFEHFVEKILPEFQSSLMSHTAIFIPSYFDFLRVRSHFRKEGIDFLQISEYSTRSDISHARTRFFHGKTRFLLYTERFYFFYRYRIRGIRNIIFYGLPQYSLFYAEILNFLDTGEAQSEFGTGTGAATCTALYTRFDAHCVAGAVGTQRCKHMISSKKNVHLFVTGNQNT